MADKNCLSYWFPKIKAAGLPVPRTTIIRTDCELDRLLDGAAPVGFSDFVDWVVAAGDTMAWPIFLRTGYTSGKHEWGRTCYVSCAANVEQHIGNLVEYSAMADIIGLPTDVWAVRELLKTNHSFHAFRGMPIGREFRAFTEGAKFRCVHPYWPPASIERPNKPDWRGRLEVLSTMTDEERGRISYLASTAAVAMGGGDWSVDCLQTAAGEWVVIDMAEAARSWHWPHDASGGPH